MLEISHIKKRLEAKEMWFYQCTVDRAGNSKENINYKETAAYNEKEGWNFGTHEERRFGDFHTHRTYWSKGKQNNLFDECEWE